MTTPKKDFYYLAKMASLFIIAVTAATSFFYLGYLRRDIFAEVKAIDETKRLIERNFAILDIEEELAKTNKEVLSVVTCYNSEVEQCDGDPFVTASGHVLAAGDMVVANNCLPFGTRVMIDNKIYFVYDRMNSRFGCEKFDIWMESKEDCLLFGRQKKIVNLLKY